MFHLGCHPGRKSDPPGQERRSLHAVQLRSRRQIITDAVVASLDTRIIYRFSGNEIKAGRPDERRGRTSDSASPRASAKMYI